jgi:hypothetical protein
MTKKLALACALATVFAGCANDAEKKCEEFTQAFCERLATCSAGTSAATSKETCLGDFAKKADCSKAVDAPKNFSECVPAVKALACSRLGEIPDSCNVSIGK